MAPRNSRLSISPILELDSVSPTGRWVSVLVVIDGELTSGIFGLGGERYRWTRTGYWPSRWAADGRTLYLEVEGEKTLPITLSGAAPPVIPPLPAPTGVKLMPYETIAFSPGPDRDTYVFTRSELLQNIYRIPLHP